MKRMLAVLLAAVLCFSGSFVRSEAAFGRTGDDRIRKDFVIEDEDEDEDDDRFEGEEDEGDAAIGIEDEEEEGPGDHEIAEEEDTDDLEEEDIDDLEEEDAPDQEDWDDLEDDDDLVPCVTPYEIAPDLSNITNTDQVWLSDEMKAFLAENGFVVNGSSSSPEFYMLYQENNYDYMPNFVTVDSLMHTFHLYFSFLLKSTEKNFLYDQLEELCADMLDESMRQVKMAKDTDWEDAALRNVAFFNVAYMLISEDGYIESKVESQVEAELALITDASVMTESPVFETLEDYSQYWPRGYYEGDPVMERYFRTMMWLGRMNFPADDEELTKSAVLITYALKEAYADLWETIYDTTSYFAGTSDDPGYYEYDELLTGILGEDYEAEDFMNEEVLADIMEEAAQLDPPMIASSYSAEEGVQRNICFRFMGQRFTLDVAVMQMLIASDVPGRGLPDTLDFLAALDSDEAEKILKAQGTIDQYPEYKKQLDKAEDYVDDLPADFWGSNLYSGWLYTLAPVLEDKEEGYPVFMQSREWARKDLETYAASYAELKHDTVLYSKQAMAEGSGDLPKERDDRGYVEPEYRVYKRLKELAGSMKEDLAADGLIDESGMESLTRLHDLAEQLELISRKELLEEPLTDEDYELIKYYGESLREFWRDVAAVLYADDPYVRPNDFPASVIADIATDAELGMALEVGTGNPNCIYVVVPVDGTLRIACGAVYSFYQFPWPSSDRLTDSKWRQIQGYQQGEDGWYHNDQAVARPNWTRSYRLEEPDEGAFPYLEEAEAGETDVKEEDPETEPEEKPEEEPEEEPEEKPEEEPENGGEPSGDYDYSALTYAGAYSGSNGYEIRFSAYTMVNESEPGVKIGNAEIIHDGKSEFALVRVFDYDPDEWDYTAVYAVELEDLDAYFGFYERRGKIMLDYFSDEEDFDLLEMTEHYES